MKRTGEEAFLFEALSQIETPEFDIAAAVAQRRAQKTRGRIRPVRRGLALALAGAVLILSVGAAGVNGMWGAFFRRIPSNAVAVVGASQTAGGYTLTIEDAIVDENGALLLLSLCRADGAEIDPQASLRTHSLDAQLLVDGERSLGSSGFQDVQYSEDGKTLYFCYEHKTSGQGASLRDKTLTLTAGGVGVQLAGPDGYAVPGETPVSLEALTEVPDCTGLDLRYRAEVGQALQAAAAQNRTLPLPRAEEFSQYAVLGAVMTEQGLSVAVSQGTCRSGDLLCTGVRCEALVDIRDGMRYHMYGSYGGMLSDGSRANLTYFKDCPLGAEDLPYLELEVSYEIDRLLSEEPFSIPFTVDKTSAMTLPVEETVTVAGVELHPTEIRLSALGILVFFRDDMDTAGFLYGDGTAPVLTLDDGSVITTHWAGGYGERSGVCSIRFSARDENMDRLFFDTSQIRSVAFGDLEIPVSP